MANLDFISSPISKIGMVYKLHDCNLRIACDLQSGNREMIWTKNGKGQLTEGNIRGDVSAFVNQLLWEDDAVAFIPDGDENEDKIGFHFRDEFGYWRTMMFKPTVNREPVLQVYDDDNVLCTNVIPFKVMSSERAHVFEIGLRCYNSKENEGYRLHKFVIVFNKDDLYLPGERTLPGFGTIHGTRNLEATLTMREGRRPSNINVSRAENVDLGFGGGEPAKDRVSYCSKMYLVRKDKDTGKKYILCARKKLFLSNIRGKYKR